MFSSPCHGWAPACGAVLCSSPSPLCPRARPAHPPSLPCSWDLTGTHSLLPELWIQHRAGCQVTVLVPCNEGFISSQVYQKQPWVVS